MAGVKGLRPCLGLLGKGDWPPQHALTNTLSRTRTHTRAYACITARLRPGSPRASTCSYPPGRSLTHVCTWAHVQEAIRELGRGLLLSGASRSLRSQNPQANSFACRYSLASSLSRSLRAYPYMHASEHVCEHVRSRACIRHSRARWFFS